MNKTERIKTFAAAAHSLFVIGSWKWYNFATKTDQVPNVHQIMETCWHLFYTAEAELVKNPNQTFTRASTGRITCVLVRGCEPEFTLDITHRK